MLFSIAMVLVVKNWRRDRLVPLGPRVSVANTVGTLMYEAFLHAMCAQVWLPPN
jgi:hypothetical protein